MPGLLFVEEEEANKRGAQRSCCQTVIGNRHEGGGDCLCIAVFLERQLERRPIDGPQQHARSNVCFESLPGGSDADEKGAWPVAREATPESLRFPNIVGCLQDCVALRDDGQLS